MPKHTNKPAGKKIKCPEGYSAFIPNPLPPEIVWSRTLMRSLSDADRAIGGLAGEGARLPNPHLLIRPFIKREAVLSSKIEGTQATLGEILAVEAGVDVHRSSHDLKEVANYVIALEYGVKRLRKIPLSVRLIREIHEKLMKGVRGSYATPGEFRKSQNWIGPAGCTLQNATYVPPPHYELMSCLSQLEKFFHDKSLPPLVQIALAHYQFESIHPFLDGNGRVGRLLVTLFLIERAILPAPLLYLSAFFEATRQEYYDRLLAVSQRGEWANWLQYFLNGVARQAEDAQSRAERINILLDKWRTKAAGTGLKVAIEIVDRLGANPYLTAKGVVKDLGVAFTTAQRAIQRLDDLSIIRQKGKAKRDKVYCAEGILKILEEPANLSP